jgi:hypothetical protein
MQTLTRLDQFAANLRVLGYTGTREEFNTFGCIVRFCLRNNVPPADDEMARAFTIAKEIWGDLL